MMVKTYPERIIREEAFINALGRITIRFALLEELITDCINILLGGESASIVTAGLPFSRSLTMLKALYMQKFKIAQDKELPVSFKEMLAKAEKANELRNRIVHSFWHKGDTKGSLERIKKQLSKRGLKIDIEQVDVEELNNIAEDIEKAAYAAQQFTWKILEKYMTYQISPMDGAVFLDTKPVFAWLNVEGAVGYELALSKAYPSIDYSISKMGNDCVRDTRYKCETPLERNTTYYW
ncbi:MAG: hypothetical protein FJ025_05740 [Chloroflexi bacterium]|nr:hypothetical protein [Chloroflexota bacterium]